MPGVRGGLERANGWSWELGLERLGSHAMFGTCVMQVLGPLHQRAGIASVKMGGYLIRRV
jgi:hypothetical protein